MPIAYDEENRVFCLDTRRTSYRMRVADYGFLEHLYYGRRIVGVPDFRQIVARRLFVCVPHDAGTRRDFIPEVLLQEYPTFEGDFRELALTVKTARGSGGADLRYAGHAIERGKPPLPGLPWAWGDEKTAWTLRLFLKDEVLGLEAELRYCVSEDTDVITRCAVIRNGGEGELTLERALSVCLDFENRPLELMTFYGQWGAERQVQRIRIPHGKTLVSSRRGVSSPQHNPAAILCTPETTEQAGECYGMMLAYSGNHAIAVERDALEQTRLTAGINPEGFSWQLAPGEAFYTPEALLGFSAEGFSTLSGGFHRFLREKMCKSPYRNKRRPVVIDSWEAYQMDFTEEKLLALADSAAALGAELLMVDDGWFGARENDLSALGDWTVNPRKFPHGLRRFVDRVLEMGLKVGFWMEPEMVSEDSALFRAHPEWRLRIPGREPIYGRYQLALDLSREDVREYIYQCVATLLRSGVTYVKWDMNRNITDWESAQLAPQRQGELRHRYVLGLYQVLERLTEDFPNVIFVNCCSGGGRMDAGMLRYMPQVWCSDNTDAVARMEILLGTSFLYPLSSIGAHVSACPNQQTGRTLSLETRAAVAWFGVFGYEMDFLALEPSQAETIRRQIAFYKEHAGTILFGSAYRLSPAWEKAEYSAVCAVSADGEEAVLMYLLIHARCNPAVTTVRLQGLDEKALYTVDGDGRQYSGGALMYGGLKMPVLYEDYAARVFVLRRVSACTEAV